MPNSDYINESNPRLKIAIVEDNELDSEICSRMLFQSNPDHSVMTYVDGTSILSALNDDHLIFDCILLDLNLPDMNGREVLEGIRKANQDIPVIFLTAVDNDMQALSAIAEGAEDYLIKGEYNGHMLSRSIAYAIERKAFALANQKLALSLEEARSINQKQREFVSLVSHELRTPLSIVSSSVYLMRRKLSDDALEESSAHLDKIEQSVKRLSGLVNNVLTYAKFEQGIYHVAELPFNLDCFLDDLVSDFVQQHHQTSYEIVGDEISTVISDKDLLEHIFINLLSNATKYADETTPKITVRKHRSVNGWRVEVEDNGRGIPEKDLRQIGERFYRASNSIDIPGVGIGVYLVKRFVQLLNGSVFYDSTLGEGTIVTVTFPLSVLKNK